MTLKELRKAVSEIPSEYDDCVVEFASRPRTIIVDRSMETSLSPIYGVAWTPDRNEVLLCDKYVIEVVQSSDYVD